MHTRKVVQRQHTAGKFKAETEGAAAGRPAPLPHVAESREPYTQSPSVQRSERKPARQGAVSLGQLFRSSAFFHLLLCLYGVQNRLV